MPMEGVRMTTKTFKDYSSKYKKPAAKKEAAKKPIEEKVEEVKEEVAEVKEPAKKKATKPKKKKGVVKASRALNVRKDPSKANNIILALPRGVEVEINNVETPEGWYNISAETKGIKVTGFVMAEFIKEV